MLFIISSRIDKEASPDLSLLKRSPLLLSAPFPCNFHQVMDVFDMAHSGNVQYGLFCQLVLPILMEVQRRNGSGGEWVHVVRSEGRPPSFYFHTESGKVRIRTRTADDAHADAVLAALGINDEMAKEALVRNHKRWVQSVEELSAEVRRFVHAYGPLTTAFPSTIAMFASPRPGFAVDPHPPPRPPPTPSDDGSEEDDVPGYAALTTAYPTTVAMFASSSPPTSLPTSPDEETLRRADAHLDAERARFAAEKAAKEARAATVIQSGYRGLRGRRLSEQCRTDRAAQALRERRAAKTIQTAYRGHRKQSHAAIAIQSGYRGHLGRKAAERRRAEKAALAAKQQHAAVTIQAAYRQHMVVRRHSATTIQAAYRGHRGRKVAADLRSEKSAQDFRKQRAAKTIQTA